jgi:hypothetical protein
MRAAMHREHYGVTEDGQPVDVYALANTAGMGHVVSIEDAAVRTIAAEQALAD